jgi:hypothetical protein
MKRVMFSTVAAAAIGLTVAGCTRATPGSPSVSFTSPLSAGPSSGSSYKFKEQPVSVSITNAVRTGESAATYSLEVATDSGFANKVFTRENIPEGGGGKTSVTLSALTASSGNVTYYWRWKASVDGVASPYSSTESFVVQQQIIVNAPTLTSPVSGSVLAELRIPFTVKNATRQGAVGPITYVFQIARDAGFTNIVASPTLPENFGGVTGETTFMPATDLPEGSIFWRVQARDDSNTEVSSFTSSQSFTLEPFDPAKAQFWNGPSVAKWQENSKITSITYFDGYMQVDFDRRDGPNRWPDAQNASFGPIQYSLGMCQKFGTQWHCSSPIQFWHGRELDASGPWRDIGANWFYDPNRWGPLRQPDFGEKVAVYAAQGNTRGSGGASYEERTNFQVVPFGHVYKR